MNGNLRRLVFKKEIDDGEVLFGRDQERVSMTGQGKMFILINKSHIINNI